MTNRKRRKPAAPAPAPAPMKITSEVLKKLRACPYEIARFKRYWPHGGALNEHNLHLAQRRHFPLAWLARHALSRRLEIAYLAGIEKTWEAPALPRAEFHKAQVRILWHLLRRQNDHTR